MKKATKRLRIKGRFVSKAFENEVKRIANATGAGHIDTQTFFNQNEEALTQLYNHGEIPSAIFYADTTIFRQAENARGQIFLNKKVVHINTLILEMVTFQQWVMSNWNCAGVAYAPLVTFQGDIRILLPTMDEMEEMEDMDGAELAEHLLSQYRIKIYISDIKGIRSKKKKEIIENRLEDKLNRNTKKLDRARKRASPRKRKGKGGTKPKKR